MTSRGLERELHRLNDGNGNHRVCVWVNGVVYDVIGVEREGKEVHVVVSSLSRTLEDEREDRRL